MRARNSNSIQKLIDSGFYVDNRDREGFTPLMEAVRLGYLEIVKLLIEGGGANPNRWADGDNIIGLATDGGHRDVVEYLRTVVSNDRHNSVNETTLLVGERRRDRKPDHRVERLVDAAMGGFEDMVIDSLKSGVDPNAIGSNGQAALHFASFYSHLGVIETLLNAGAHVDVLNEEGLSGGPFATPLCLVAGSFFAEHRCDVITMLLDAGANPNAQDTIGRTPLMNAVFYQSGYPDAVQCLLNVGVDASLMDREGHTAQSLAEKLGRTEITSMLRAAE